MKKMYKKSKGNAGLDGVQFQLNLLTVFLLNALHSRKNWKISTENQEAGKYDDIVLELPNKSILLQAKFKQNKKINKDQLFSCNSKNADFSLPKYFFSYLEIKSTFADKSVIVCTNTDMDEKGLEIFLTGHHVGPESMLYYEGATFKLFTFNDNILGDLKASVEIFLEQNLQGKGIDKTVITNKNLKDFLKHLQLVSNYPSADKLDKVIGQLLFRMNNSCLYQKISSHEIYKKIEDWFKQPKGEYLTEERAKAMFSEIKSDKFCEELMNYNVSFENLNFNFTDTIKIFQINCEEGYFLQVLKIYDALQKDESKKLYVDPDDDIEVLKCAIEAFKLPRYAFLIIIVTNIIQDTAIKEISNKLRDILKESNHKKAILVVQDKLSQQIELNDIFYIDRPVTFDDLSDECQKRLAKEKNIIFQGEEFSLEELLSTQVNEGWSKAVNSEILEKLIKNNEIKVGLRPSNLNELSFQCYIYRTFKRQICTNGVVNQANDVLKEKTFRQTVTPLNPSGKRSNNIIREDTFSEESIYNMNEDVVLIADSAGMGKSTVLTKLAATIKEKNRHLWVIKIELTEYTSVLRYVLMNHGEIINVMELLNSKDSTKLTNHLERYVFSMNKKVVLMLDGIDEISPDYTELVLNMLSNCQEAHNFAKLFVTTRPHMIKQLEEILKVKPFVLQPFTEQDQVTFLTSYWGHNLKVCEDKRKVQQYAKALIRRMSSWTKRHRCYKEEDFTVIPLHLRMLAEIFQENINWNQLSNWEGCKEYLKGSRVEPKLPEKMEIKDLYDMFIEKKRDTYIHKANPIGNSAANKALINQFDVSFAYHRNLALKVVLNYADCKLFSCYEQDYENIDDNILKIGIVQRSNDEFQFIHRTFAEYFVAEIIVSELQIQLHRPNVRFQNFFLHEVLLFPIYTIIRAFADNFLQKFINSIPSNIFEKYQSHTRYSFYWMCGPDLIHSLVKEGCITILQLILKCVNFKIIRCKEMNVAALKDHISRNKENVFLSFARTIGINVDDKKGNILKAIQIIVREAGINIKNKSGQTPLHFASQNGQFEMVKFLAEQGAKIDSTDNDGKTALHLAAVKGDLDTVSYLIKSSDNICTKDNNGRTALHIAAENGQLDTIKLFLERGIDCNVRDIDGNTPLHLAASNGQLNMVKFLLKLGTHSAVHSVDYTLKSSDNVNVKNDNGRTPLHFAAANGHLDVVKFLLEFSEVFNIKDNNGSMALHHAAAGGQLSIVEYFVEYSDDASAKDKQGRTALHLAAANGHLTTVKVLLELGVGVNLADNYGRTALHLAAANGHLNTVKFFLEQGMDFNIEDNYGYTALRLAHEWSPGQNQIPS